MGHMAARIIAVHNQLKAVSVTVCMSQVNRRLSTVTSQQLSVYSHTSQQTVSGGSVYCTRPFPSWFPAKVDPRNRNHHSEVFLPVWLPSKPFKIRQLSVRRPNNVGKHMPNRLAALKRHGVDIAASTFVDRLGRESAKCEPSIISAASQH